MACRIAEPSASVFSVETIDDYFVPENNGSLLEALHRASDNNKAWHSFIIIGPPKNGKRTAINLVRRSFLKARGESQINPCIVINCLSKSEHGEEGISKDGDDTPSSVGIQYVRQKLSILEKDFTSKRLVCVHGVDNMTQDAQKCMLTSMESQDVMFILSCENVYNVVPALLSRCERVTTSPVSLPQPSDSTFKEFIDKPFNWLIDQIGIRRSRIKSDKNIASFFRHIRCNMGENATKAMMYRIKAYSKTNKPKPTMSEMIHMMHNALFVDKRNETEDTNVKHEMETDEKDVESVVVLSKWSGTCDQLQMFDINPILEVSSSIHDTLSKFIPRVENIIENTSQSSFSILNIIKTNDDDENTIPTCINICQELSTHLKDNVCKSILDTIMYVGSLNTYNHVLEPLYRLVTKIRTMSLAIANIATDTNAFVIVQRHEEWRTNALEDINVLKNYICKMKTT